MRRLLILTRFLLADPLVAAQPRAATPAPAGVAC